MIASNIDSLVLGCTHYPYLIPQIREIVGSKIKIIDSGEAVAKQTKTILSNLNLLNMDKSNEAKHQLYINKEKTALEHLLHSIKGKNILFKLALPAANLTQPTLGVSILVPLTILSPNLFLFKLKSTDSAICV